MEFEPTTTSCLHGLQALKFKMKDIFLPASAILDFDSRKTLHVLTKLDNYRYVVWNWWSAGAHKTTQIAARDEHSE